MKFKRTIKWANGDPDWVDNACPKLEFGAVRKATYEHNNGDVTIIERVVEDEDSTSSESPYDGLHSGRITRDAV